MGEGRRKRLACLLEAAEVGEGDGVHPARLARGGSLLALQSQRPRAPGDGPLSVQAQEPVQRTALSDPGSQLWVGRRVTQPPRPLEQRLRVLRVGAQEGEVRQDRVQQRARRKALELPRQRPRPLDLSGADHGIQRPEHPLLAVPGGDAHTLAVR